jgi:predicted ATPase
MRIERVIFRGLRALRERDDRFVNADGEVLSAICLRGLNGSGKTTYLEALAQLWQWFRRCTQKRGFALPTGTELLGEARLAAALLTDLPGPRPRMWVAFGDIEELRSLQTEPDFALSIGKGRAGTVWHPEILAYWEKAIASAEAGMDYQQFPPNIVCIEAENKYVPELRNDEISRRATAAYYPVARYLPNARGSSHLESIMRTLFLTRRNRWNILSRSVATLRPGLQLMEQFEETTQRPLFKLATGELLTTERLSAGERSVLINLSMILRWLAPGGIVLLDEPELHQHLSLMRRSLAAIAQIIEEEFHGQIFVASHAPEVWDFFRRTDAIVDLQGAQ